MIKVMTKHLLHAVVNGGDVRGVDCGMGGSFRGWEVFAVFASEAYLAQGYGFVFAFGRDDNVRLW